MERSRDSGFEIKVFENRFSEPAPFIRGASLASACPEQQ
jgi:hypothetical protein